jgi:methionyl-tRNA formyltransferase
MRVVFLGSPPFAVPVLRDVCASRHSVLALVTRPDKPKGRGQRVAASPLVELAREKNVPVLQPASAREPSFVAELRALAPDVLLVASYGEILKRELLELAPHGALNVHASLLPRHRGASPIQAALLAGDRETGVSIQRMVAKLDEGDVLLSLATPIGEHEHSGELLERLAPLGADVAVRALDLLERGDARFTPQDPALATYAKKIEKEDGRVDWSLPAETIVRRVRAFTPWPGARTTDPNGAEIVLLDARVDEARASDACRGVAPGAILPAKDALVVATGSRAVEIRALQPAGKGRMDGAAWLRGARFAAGARLGTALDTGVDTGLAP